MSQCYFAPTFFDFKKVHNPEENKATGSLFIVFLNVNSPSSVILLLYSALPGSHITAIHINFIFKK